MFTQNFVESAISDNAHPSMAPYYFDLISRYAEHKAAPPGLISHILTDPDSIWSYVWEAHLAQKFQDLAFDLAHTPKKSGQNGPDFCIMVEGKRVFIEAISPKGTGIPEPYSNRYSSNETRAYNFPHQELLLRWTSAIKTKAEKSKKYLTKDIISKDDVFIIAINGGQFSSPIDMIGISQLPFPVEAVYGAGPIAVPYNKITNEFGKYYQSFRAHVLNANDSPVDTAVFLNPEFSHVSGIIASNALHLSQMSSFVIVPNAHTEVVIPKQLLTLGDFYSVSIDQGNIFITPPD